MDPEECFAGVVAALRDRPGVAPSDPTRRAFGADALTVHGSIFAMLRDAALVVKLPAPRVSALIAAGDGAPFGAGRGRPMKEWVAVPAVDPERWLALAEEAWAFVGPRQE
ncbi:TfoX/Sxy family protein [Actinomycetospora endophytica]|uniref:TfoX/Sxy family protein n=1 Tax=Actinomycetospora endophytica TaxID=2291215 RepID=A0ABS8P5N3_9PSEU|nr:TfoX/Sxy family protein [Actinomycetospora endophytica]MCD2193570.1 TfoX/Sxy family protein [Actinomycetospora endophytica]